MLFIYVTRHHLLFNSDVARQLQSIRQEQEQQQQDQRGSVANANTVADEFVQEDDNEGDGEMELGDEEVAEETQVGHQEKISCSLFFRLSVRLSDLSPRRGRKKYSFN